MDNISPHILAQLANALAPIFRGNSGQAGPGSSGAASSDAPTLPVVAPHHPQAVTGTANPNAQGSTSVLPAIGLYQSARLPQTQLMRPLAQFALPTPPPSNSQRPPAQGSSTGGRLAGLPDTRAANSQRLASAAASLPPRASLAIRTARVPSGSSGISRRGRGPAGHPPSLTQPQPSAVESVYFDAPNGERHIKLRCKIYPPRTGEHIVYLRQRDSFNLELSRNHLLHNLDVPVSTTVHQLLRMLADALMQSPFAYIFDEDEVLLPHESIPLILLRVSNRARRRPSTNQIYLVDYPITSPQATIQSLVSDPVRIVFQDISFEDGHLVLFVGVQGETLSGLLSEGAGSLPRRHSCIAQRLWSKFPDDNRRNRSRQDPEDTSGGETEVGNSDDDNDTMSITSDLDSYDPPELPNPIPTQPLNRPTAATRPQNPSSAPYSQPNPPPRSVPVARTDTLTLIGPTLWATPWSPPPLASGRGLDLGDLDQEVFDLAVCGVASPPSLIIRGTTTLDLAQTLLGLVGEAVDRNDFTQILSSDRHFIISGPRLPGASLQQHPPALSLGAGIEKEVVYLAYQHYKTSYGQWFTPKAGGYSSIALSTRWPSAVRLRDLAILGGMTGLLLVCGIPPDPVSPALIQYLLHDGNLQSLHPAFVQEWLPDLYVTLTSWLDTSPQENDLSKFSSHFSSFHDTQVAALRGRDQTGHHAIAAEMLHKAVISSEPFTHPELQAFFSGFKMNCARSGFNITKLSPMIQGGSEALLNMVWTGQVKTFDDLAGHIRFKIMSTQISNAIAPALARLNISSMQTLFESFLQGSGIPCPDLFDDAKNHFGSFVDLKDIDDPSFRPKSFTWAATGGPTIDIAGPGIQASLELLIASHHRNLTSSCSDQLILCWEGDLAYASSSMQRAMIAEGKVCFKTCAKEVRAPAQYLLKLAAAASDAESFQRVFDHWMLCEVLNGIGRHSIL